MAFGPPHQAHDHGVEVERPLGQPVLVPVGVRAVTDAFEHPVAHELPQPVSQDVAGDAEVALHLSVAAHPEECLPQDQERPAVADHVDGELHGIARRPDWSVVSLGQLVRPLLWIHIETSFYMKPYVLLQSKTEELTAMPPETIAKSEHQPAAQAPTKREKTHFSSGDTTCAAWHYPGTNGGCVIMAGGLAVNKEPGTDLFARRFHAAGFTVLAFDYRHLGESGGQPRQIVPM